MTTQLTDHALRIPVRLYVVSSDVFEKMNARARDIAEEIWRRYVFDNPNMNPQALVVIRPAIIDLYMEMYLRDVVNRAHEFYEKHNKPSATQEV